MTDLQPSIAFGVEPGEKLILKPHPWPNTQPLVLGWMGMSIVMNNVVLAAATAMPAHPFIPPADVVSLHGPYGKAQVVNSFDRLFGKNLLGNPAVLGTINFAVLCPAAAAFLPILLDLMLGLRGASVGLWGCAVALREQLCANIDDYKKHSPMHAMKLICNYVSTLAPKCWSELSGVAILVSTAGLSVVIGPPAAAWLAAAAPLCLIYSIGDISGRHSNPCVTLGAGGRHHSRAEPRCYNSRNQRRPCQRLRPPPGSPAFCYRVHIISLCWHCLSVPWM